jgi:hypothetical protein
MSEASLSKQPQRRNQLVIKIGADTWEDAKTLLISLLIDIDRYTDREELQIATGGYSSGGTVRAWVNEGVTHDSYMEASNKWLEEQEEAQP